MSVRDRVRENESEFIGIRRKIHENPELSFKEFETTKLIKAYLDDLGIENHPNGEDT